MTLCVYQMKTNEFFSIKNFNLPSGDKINLKNNECSQKCSPQIWAMSKGNETALSGWVDADEVYVVFFCVSGLKSFKNFR